MLDLSPGARHRGSEPVDVGLGQRGCNQREPQDKPAAPVSATSEANVVGLQLRNTRWPPRSAVSVAAQEPSGEVPGAAPVAGVELVLKGGDATQTRRAQPRAGNLAEIAVRLRHALGAEQHR